MEHSSLSERLLSEFSPKLDSALILAIAADANNGGDDHQEQHEADARATLQALADATSEETYNPLDNIGNDAAAAQDALSATTDTASTLTSTTTSTTDDEEAVERAFQAWSIEDSQLDDEESHKDLIVFSQTDASLDPISFLKNLFPKRERIELQVAFEDAGEDIQLTIETLLTEDFLIREEEEYLLSLQEDQANGLNGKSGKHRQKRKLGKQTISLTSTPRGVQSDLPAQIRDEQEKSNVWIKTDSTILYLSQLLSVPPGTLSSLFYSNNNSLPLAVSKILDQAEVYHDAIPEEEEKLIRLRELFPNSPLDPLRRCLYATEGDIPKTVELYKVLEDIHARDGTPLAHGLLLQAKPYKSQPTALAAAPAAQRLAQSMPSSPALHRTRSDRPPTAQECLVIANTVRAKRDDAYRSAARTWRGKAALGNSGVAAYWADHARQLDREARQWELKAARETVEERRKVARSAQSIDLHGLTANQALTVTNESLNAWWHNPSAPPSLTIITGAGKHSAGQAPVILPVVRKLLEREGYDWKYEGDRFNRGSVVVTGLQGRRKGSGW